jgi:hypothetical protein
MTKPIVIRRSPWRMWGIALIGMPLGLVALDVLTQRRMANALRDLLFRPEETQLLEPRDVLWGWVMLAVGLGMAVWGLKELILPTVVVAADADGVGLKVRGPARALTPIPWSVIDDIGSGSVDDEGDSLPVVWIRLVDPGLVPEEPWGARWMDDSTLAILASDWDRSATTAARELTEVALAAARFAAGGEEE